MDFREGGAWHYAMIGPDQSTHWCRADYESIDFRKSYAGLDAFCNEEGDVNPEFPRSHWTNVFHAQGEETSVQIAIRYPSLEALEQIISLGFKEGFTAALSNLDAYIETRIRMRAQLNRTMQPRVVSYLNFPGNTEEAFLFYKNVFRTDFNGGLERFGDVTKYEGHPPVPDALKHMIIHVELPITGHHILMGTDAPKEMGFTVTQGNNMHISIEPETKEEADRLFNELSKDGVVSMPMQNMFWGAYFGSFTDKFGINWMINYLSPRN
jgi:uncharacterized glyoxalase superfamily protein PhnB